MEALLVIVGLLFFLCPLIALAIAIGARSRTRELEHLLQQQHEGLLSLKQALSQLQTKVDRAAASASARSTAASAEPIKASSPILTTEVPEPAPTPEPVPESVPVPEPEPTPEPVLTPEPVSAPALSPEPVSMPEPVSTPEPVPTPEAVPTPEPAPRPAPAPARPRPRPPLPRREPAPPPAWVSTAKNWLFGGNLVAKLGLLILFIGVSFLVKYAAQRFDTPIELHLSAIVLADIALLLWGWRIRITRPGIALPVQGGAMAILMLVTFAAFRMYHLIPSGMAFALLFVLTAFTCLLAVLQNALWLAIFGIVGGFAAPILTSTGQGSHIGLFSYYALLNAGVLSIALYRSWRSLNLISFVFTFVVGTTWGVLKYAPENYASAQAFLILFFLFYVAIAIVYGARQASQNSVYVDATLVFGTPLIAFGLQYNLVKSMPFGIAFSALALGLFYTVLTLTLWRKRGTSLKMLSESFLAMGLVFGTLTLPFALDGRWTSAAWALEGAGIVWIGLRQRQNLVWLFGLLVQAGAWLSFMGTLGNMQEQVAKQSNIWLGFLLLAATAFLMATRFRSHAQSDDKPRFGSLAAVLLVIATLWFVVGAWVEVFLHTDGSLRMQLVAASGLFTVGLLLWIAHKLAWAIANLLGVILQILAGLFLLGLMGVQEGYGNEYNLLHGPFLGALLIGGAAALTARLFQRIAPERVKLSNGLLLWSGFWWFGLILGSFCYWLSLHFVLLFNEPIKDEIIWSNYGLWLALTGLLWSRLAQSMNWPALRWFSAPTWLGMACCTLYLLVEMLLTDRMPRLEVWIGFAALWLASQWLMRSWQRANWALPGIKFLHTVRTLGPWLMIWPVCDYWFARWFALDPALATNPALLKEAGWFDFGNWAGTIAVWLMMLATGVLMRLAGRDSTLLQPIGAWYKTRIISFMAGLMVLVVVFWNFSQSGGMAPLPYLPLLNPLDISTAFAVLLLVHCWRLQGFELSEPRWARVPFMAGMALYVWFNLILLRTASHVLDIPYRFDPMFESTVVQTMLSLVWSITALILMRRATIKIKPNQWRLGAILLGVVVAKLFLIDQTDGGGASRIVAFVGVGLLMLAIGYIAPYPKVPAEPGDQTKQDLPPTDKEAEAS